MQLKFTRLFWLLFVMATPAVASADVTTKVTELENRKQTEIRGRILDQDGAPISGASITNLTTRAVVQSDGQGNFAIGGAVGDRMQVSFVGFQTLVQTAGETSQNTFRLTALENTLEEVTVSIGYQTIRKSDLTGAIASVKADELNLTSPKLSQALVGKVAGVQISQTSGAPYDGTKIRVRGIGSVNAGSDPLYVIDGYPAGNNLNINPNDIESIDVLKDAASAAIYGSRAAGGVVLITTKRGKEGKSNIDYEVLAGFGQLSKKIDLLNADQFIDLLIDGRNNSYKDLVLGRGLAWTDDMRMDSNAARVARVGNAGSVTIPEDYYDFATGRAKPAQYNTDWQDELYRNAPFQRHNISVSGGNDKNRYFVSGSYQNQEGIMLGTGQQVFNFRSNVDSKVTDWLNFGANVSFTYNDNEEVTTGRYDRSPSMAALIYLPTLPAYNEDGSYAQYLMGDLSANNYGIQNPENPLAYVTQIKNNRKGKRGLYNAYADFKIIDGLNFKLNGGLSTYDEKYDYYRPTSISNGNYAPFTDQAKTAAYADALTKSSLDKLLEATLNYNKTFAEKHQIMGLLGYSAQQTDLDYVGVRARGFQSDAIGEITDKGADPSNFQMLADHTFKRTTTMISYFGRVNYSFDSKYFLSASYRRDASSRFGPNSKWGAFPSVSGGWTISNEDFYDNWLGAGSTLKLRASWGKSGNNNIGDYRAITVYNSPGGVIIGDRVATAYWPDDLRDPNLSWETTSQTNLGLDFGLLRGRVNVMANAYLSQSSNLLFNQPITAVSGATTILTNLPDSKVENKGFDVQLDAAIIRKTDFDFGFSGNINVNRNKVLDLGGASTILTNGAERSYLTHITQEGSPIGMFYGFKVLGIANEQNYDKVAPSSASSTPLQPGDLYFEDVDGNGVVNDDDKRIIGNPHPKFTYGFSFDARYKHFDIRASFNGSQGNQVLDGYDYYLYNMEGSGNQYADVAQRYRSAENPGNGSVYRASRGGTQSNSTRLSTFYLQDGSFLRMTNILLGYSLPADVAQKWTLAGVRVYASVDNPFTITKYKGYNPEPDYNQRGNLTPGVDYGLYPLVRSYNLGLKVTF
ncbi:SusC/RagA family TonB-linked outer membrane protein [Sphingobacterium wenxiniae]|uniref:TonB-linked outer membrane protein, SusC/RagA family n=1 Tax=Sphingobacterium wenxiniae TaxID=683125 RepID=A0A1I6PHB5_9SPHI|nr:TonB-dependent receptor [Sphingobacterium wenxiniae]SFS39445.1 TonB-linked outer membrane protein, SusC/RagA family [Sphingobacterium wenxiniae]